MGIRYLLLIIAVCFCFSASGQNVGNPKGTWRVLGKGQVDSAFYLIKYRGDSTKVLGVDVNGLVYLKTAASTLDTSSLSSRIDAARAVADAAADGFAELDTTKQDLLTGPGYVKMSGGLVTYVTAIPNADLANSTISGKALGTNLSNLTASDGTIKFASGSSYNGSAARDIAVNPDTPQAFFNLLNLGGTIAQTGEVTPAQLTANVNDWDIADYTLGNKISVIRVSSDATRNITGLSNGNLGGQIVTILNVGANDVVLKNASGSSSVGNRFILPADYTIAPDEGVTVWYDGADGAWRMVAKEPAAGGSGITTINSELADDQFLVTGTSGTDFAISSSAGTHTFNIPTASSSNRGLVTSAMYDAWQAKQAALSGTGFVKISGTTISYDNSTYLTTSSAASTYQPLDADLTTLAGNDGSGLAMTAAYYIKSASTIVDVYSATAPSSGQVLTATGSTAATWQTPSVAIGSQVTGLGTGVATFLGTPSSANLASAITNETGSGALVFATSPAFTTPDLGTPSAAVLTNATGTASGLTAGEATAALGIKTATTTVSVSGATAPSSGQVLTATSSTNATWQTPTGGATWTLLKKTSDQSTTNGSGSPVDITDLQFAVTSGERYCVKATLYASSNGSSAISITFPNSGIFSSTTGYGWAISGTATIGAISVGSAFNGTNSTNVRPWTFQFDFIAQATGTFTIPFFANTSGQTVTIKAKSFIEYQQL